MDSRWNGAIVFSDPIPSYFRPKSVFWDLAQRRLIQATQSFWNKWVQVGTFFWITHLAIKRYRCSGGDYHKVVTSSLQEEKPTDMTTRKVVALEILYQTVENKATSRLVFVPKTRLESLYVRKIFEKISLSPCEILRESLVEDSNQSACDWELISLSSGTRISHLSFNLRPLWSKYGDHPTSQFHVNNWLWSSDNSSMPVSNTTKVWGPR